MVRSPWTIPRTPTPWDGKDSGTVVALVGYGNPEDFPWSPWDFGMGRTVQDCGGLGGTWESRRLPIAPLGLWDGKDSGTVVVLGVPRTSHGPIGTLGCSDRTP